MKTTGDKFLTKPLTRLAGKVCCKELDRALLDGKVDITVHSFKDMPMDIDDRLPIVAFQKGKTQDVLVLPKGKNEIDFNGPIGCSSSRRKIQIEKIYPAAQSSR